MPELFWGFFEEFMPGLLRLVPGAKILHATEFSRGLIVGDLNVCLSKSDFEDELTMSAFSFKWSLASRGESGKTLKRTHAKASFPAGDPALAGLVAGFIRQNLDADE